MSFIRPEILERMIRWRESLFGAAAVLLGSYLALTGTQAAKIIGTGLVIGGVMLVVAGIQRARFRRGGQGPGIVSLVEGRLTYFGPQDGGVVAIADLAAVDLVTRENGSSWELDTPDRSPLVIPVDAAGADVLFDVFGALDGMDTAAMLRAVETARPGRVMIWAKSAGWPRVSAH